MDYGYMAIFPSLSTFLFTKALFKNTPNIFDMFCIYTVMLQPFLKYFLKY